MAKKTNAELQPPAASDVAVVADAEIMEMPKKKRRTLRDAEQELDNCRVSLKEARRKLIVTARENAKMKVLLMKYIDKDDSLLSTSQLSVAETEQNSQQLVVSDTTTQSYSTTSFDEDEDEEDDSERSSLWNTTSTTDFSADGTEDAFTGTGGATATGTGTNSFFHASQLSQVSQLSQMSQMSQMSQWSELSSTSNLDEIINFLEKQDVHESERVTSLEAEYKQLKASNTCVRVGVGVLLSAPLQHPQCVLVGVRKGSHGAGKLALPGGHLELFESWKECAVREVKEEVDVDLAMDDVRFAYVTNDPMESEDKHYITIFMEATIPLGQVPKNMEPHKCEKWQWVKWQSLQKDMKDKLFVPLHHLTQSGFVPKLMEL